ncbi:hypothetical protein BH09VER1_BH09VER1_26440 [soil metagenome]
MKSFRARTEWHLEDVVITLDALEEHIPITLQQVCEGIIVMGATGSGKTSGAHDHLSFAMMSAGYGILALCVKPDEGARIRALAVKAGREDDVVTLSLDGDQRYNFLDTLKESGADAVVTAFEQIAEVLTGVTRQNEWSLAAGQHLRNLVRLFLLAGKSLQLSELRLAASNSQLHKALLVDCRLSVAAGSPDEHALKMLEAYFGREWAAMGDKTRASILMSLTPALDPFCSGPMHTLFCTSTTISPQSIRDGRILVVDIPCIGERGKYGIAAATIVKYMTQRMAETYFCNGKSFADHFTRPVVILADEAHYIATGKDAEFSTTSRSMRASLFYLTQDIHNFWRKGGPAVKSETGMLLNNLHGVRLLHQTECTDTYHWFVNVLGREWSERLGMSAGFNGTHGSGTAGANLSFTQEFPISKRDVEVGLARGGPDYRYVVTGLLQQAGRLFTGGRLFSQVAFQQMTL